MNEPDVSRSIVRLLGWGCQGSICRVFSGHLRERGIDVPKAEPKVGKFIKFRPEMWAGLQAEADSQHRSLTNLLEVIVLRTVNFDIDSGYRPVGSFDEADREVRRRG